MVFPCSAAKPTPTLPAFEPSAAPAPARAAAPATCGELAQGHFAGRDFLINSPIDLAASAEAWPTASGEVRVVTPGVWDKVSSTARDLMTQYGLLQAGWGVVLTIRSRIPRGKGLASSSAEVTAALAAIARAFRLTLRPETLVALSIRHDTSDGVAYPGIARVDHLRGELLAGLGAPPPLRFVVVDTGGAVDSVGFDRERARAVARAESTRMTEAVRLITDGLRLSEPRLIAEGATLSARINDRVLPKPGFDELLVGTREVGGLGVNCAHTGTVLGVIYDPRATDRDRLHTRIAALVGTAAIIGDHQLVAGGAR